MTIWDMLGISPSTEPRKIKRAYSKRIALFHPEDDPEGFQRLQKAYELALAYAADELYLEDLEEAGFDSFDEDDYEDQDDLIESIELVKPTEPATWTDEEDAEEQEEDQFEFSEEHTFLREKPEPAVRTIPIDGTEGWNRKDAFSGFLPPEEPVSAAKTFNLGDAQERRVEAADRARKSGAGTFAHQARKNGADASANAHVRVQSDNTPENLTFVREFIKGQQEDEEKKLRKMRAQLEMLEELIEDDGDVMSFFKLGIYEKYRSVEGFEETLVELLKPYIEDMNLVDLAELQEAVGYDEDDGGPLDTMFTARYEQTSPLNFIKDVFSFVRRK